MTTLQPASVRPASFDELLLDHMAALRRRVRQIEKEIRVELVRRAA